MIKGKLDFKLINTLLIAVLVYLFYQLKDLWLNILNKIIAIIFPLFMGFTLAYAICPVLNYFNKHKIPKIFGIFLVFIIILLIFIIIFISLIPMLSNQILSLFEHLIIFLSNIENQFLAKLITELSIPDSIFKTINISIDVITNLAIVIASSIYFSLDMDKMRLYLKKHLNEKIYKYLKMLDNEMNKYLSGFLKIIFISFFEYTITYYIVGHPNFLLLGILAALSNFIPYFGGLIVQVISVITALVISQTLGIKVFLLTLILSLFDSYILNPLVYGKTSELHPLVVIISTLVGGIFLGVFGIIISIPISIIIINTIKFYKESVK